MRTFVLLALASMATALSGHFHEARFLHGRLARSVHDRQQLTRRANQNMVRRRAAYHRTSVDTRLALRKRKTPLGPNDSTSAPDNLAPDTFTAAEGCTCWHTVQAGEVCLGLIDKSTAAFTMDVFLQYNPSVSSGCGNLVTGLAYCVDNGKNGSDAAATTSSAAAAATGQQLVSTQRTSNSTSTDDGNNGDDDEDSCDDSDDSDNGNDSDEEDCEEEDDGTDSSSSSDGLDEPLSSTKAPSENTPVTVQRKIATSTTSADESKPTSTGSQFSGVATWYTQNGVAGNCGTVSTDGQFVVALFTPVYDNGAHCGQKVQLTASNGNTVTATVQDSCPGCAGSGNIDLSVATFNKLSNNNPGLGVLDVKWSFIS